MKGHIIFTFFIFILASCFDNAFGQTGCSWLISTKRTEIVSTLGNDYTSDITDDGIKYIFYTGENESEYNRKYASSLYIYFTQDEFGDDVCFFWQVVEPAYEANKNIKYFNSTQVNIGDLKWKDFQHNTITEISITDDFCIIQTQAEAK